MKHATGRLLRWLDTDISYLLRGGGWTATSQFLSIGLSLATSYVFANYLSQTEYGTYKYVLAAAALFAIPALSGMNTAVLQSVAQGHDGTVRAALNRRLVWGALGIFAGMVISMYYFIQGDTVLGWAFLIAGLCSPIIESLSVAQATLLGKKRFDIASLTSMVSNTAISILVIGAVLLTHDPLWVLAVFFISTLILRIGTAFIAYRYIENSSISKESLAFGVHTSIAGILGVIATNADVFVIWHVNGAESLALYAFALAAVVPFQTLVKTGINLAHPKFAAQDVRTLIHSTKRRAGQMFLLLLPVVAGVIVILPPLFSLLFPAYTDSVIYAQVLALSVLLYSEKLYGIALTVARQSKALYAISTVSAVTRIGSLFILIPLFGAWGAILSLLVQQAAALITTRLFFYKMEQGLSNLQR